MKCDPMPIYKGNKSEKIMQMVSLQTRRRLAKEIPERIKKYGLDKLHEEIQAKRAEIQALKDKMDALCNKACLYYGETYENGKKVWFRVGECDCDTIVKAELELANRAWELGDKEKAKKIWDKVTKEYRLLQ
jgi:hypothetical protein